MLTLVGGGCRERSTVQDATVRKTTLMALSHLILNDMVKVRALSQDCIGRWVRVRWLTKTSCGLMLFRSLCIWVTADPRSRSEGRAVSPGRRTPCA